MLNPKQQKSKSKLTDQAQQSNVEVTDQDDLEITDQDIAEVKKDRAVRFVNTPEDSDFF